MQICRGELNECLAHISWLERAPATAEHRPTCMYMGIARCIMFGQSKFGSKKTNKQKAHKHFSDGPCGTIVPGTNPHPSQGQTGQNGDFTVELNRERPVCPRDGSHFVPGRGPICPRDGACLSRTPSRRKCLCLLGFFLPEQRQTRCQ